MASIIEKNSLELTIPNLFFFFLKFCFSYYSLFFSYKFKKVCNIYYVRTVFFFFSQFSLFCYLLLIIILINVLFIRYSCKCNPSICISFLCKLFPLCNFNVKTNTKYLIDVVIWIFYNLSINKPN